MDCLESKIKQIEATLVSVKLLSRANPTPLPLLPPPEYGPSPYTSALLAFYGK